MYKLQNACVLEIFKINDIKEIAFYNMWQLLVRKKETQWN